MPRPKTREPRTVSLVCDEHPAGCLVDPEELLTFIASCWLSACATTGPRRLRELRRAEAGARRIRARRASGATPPEQRPVIDRLEDELLEALAARAARFPGEARDLGHDLALRR